jgi:hypothetical protein
LTLIGHLRHEFPTMAIVIMTASQRDPALPGIPVLRKPFALDQLHAAIHTVISA